MSGAAHDDNRQKTVECCIRLGREAQALLVLPQIYSVGICKRLYVHTAALCMYVKLRLAHGCRVTGFRLGAVSRWTVDVHSIR